MSEENNNENMFAGLPHVVDIPPGGSRDITFGVDWIKGKREVHLIFGDNEDEMIILNEEIIKKRGCPVLTVSADNTNPIRAEIVPDFDKNEINIIEISNENTKEGNTENTKLMFGGLERVNK